MSNVIGCRRAAQLITPTPRDWAHSRAALTEKMDWVLKCSHEYHNRRALPWHLHVVHWFKQKRFAVRCVVTGIVIGVVIAVLTSLAMWAHGYTQGVSEMRVEMSGPKHKILKVKGAGK